MKQVISILSCMLMGLLLSAQTVKWTWMGGDSTVNNPEAVNKPGSRLPMYTWTDKEGNFYMFAGNIATNPFFADYQPVLSNALWKYNPLANSWTKISGTNASIPNTDVEAAFGTPGVPAPGNTPGSTRDRGASWVDQYGNFWLYGGKTGARAWGTNSDLWKFDPVISQWTFISGNGGDVVPHYGIKGIPAPSNNPGARTGATSWTDNNGNLYLYGGNLQNLIGPSFGDVWKYDISSKLWTWVSGSQWNLNTPDQPVYGTPGIFAPENTPGMADDSRVMDIKDSSGMISMSINGERWSYAVSTDQWAWISGIRKFPQPTTARNYGVKGVPSDTSNPGTRSGSARWRDSIGNVWLFGGMAMVSNVQYIYFNDLWKYTEQTRQWTWVAGDSTVNKAPAYGTKGIAADINQPGARTVTAFWKDAKGDMWLFGGSPRLREECCIISWYNDLWKLSGTKEAALPVKLSSFTAQKQQQTALLKWTTYQEQNSRHFVVERSSDGTVYDSIGKVAAVGTASSSTDYSFTDKGPLQGSNYYRLKQVDQDGMFLYSSIAKVVMEKDAAHFTVVRNPVLNTLYLHLELPSNQQMTMQVRDIDGHTLLRKVDMGRTGSSVYTLSIGHLATGTYFISVQSENISGTKSFIKQ